MRLLLRGPYNPYTGYGNDLIGLAMALDRRLDVEVIPDATAIAPPLPKEAAALFTKEPAGRFDAAIIHLPPFALRPPESTRAASARVVGWTMWEQTRFTSEHMKGHGQGRRPWKNVDHIVCYDSVSKEALDFYDARVPKSVIQGGVDVDYWEYGDRDWSGTFRFGMIGELSIRKDPMVAIEAFKELRDEGRLDDAELVMKSSKPGLHPKIEEWAPGVKVLHGSWPRDQIRTLMRSLHCLVAPSRGEGKNLPALEMMLTGGVVIATNWGGHTGWLHPDYAFPLDYTLAPMEPGGESMMARADKEHLKQLMVKAYENRGMCRQMGQVASRTIRQSHSWDAVANRMVNKLRSL